MKRIKNIEIVLDADDVLLDCNAYALSLLNKDVPGDYSMDNITDWGLLGIPEDRRLDYLNDRSFYLNQPAFPGAREFLRELSRIANVTIMTAVYPQFMGERIQRLCELFPEFPPENILMGKRKEILNADILLDDGVHNLMSSGAALPVLFRQPWNRHVSGLCCINNYSEFLSLANILAGNKLEDDILPKIFCIVGPSGSGKHQLADALCTQDNYVRIRTCTTALSSGGNRRLTFEEFEKYKQNGYFMESTYYCGEQYALPAMDIDQALSRGSHAVAVMDISGCMAVHNHYPGQAVIIYAQRDKKECVHSILRKPDMSIPHQADRILSIDLEQKNKVLADHIIPSAGKEDYIKAMHYLKSLYG